MNEAIQRRTQNTDGVTLYRGMKNVQIKLAVGTPILFKEFVSTSKSRKVAQGFASQSGVLFEIDGGDVTGADVAKFSPYPEEEEILLAPYQQFVVTAIKGNVVKMQSTGDSAELADVMKEFAKMDMAGQVPW